MLDYFSDYENVSPTHMSPQTWRLCAEVEWQSPTGYISAGREGDDISRYLLDPALLVYILNSQPQFYKQIQTCKMSTK